MNVLQRLTARIRLACLTRSQLELVYDVFQLDRHTLRDAVLPFICAPPGDPLFAAQDADLNGIRHALGIPASPLSTTWTTQEPITPRIQAFRDRMAQLREQARHL